MTAAEDARDDLAYLRSLVAAPAAFQRSFGQGYFWAGVCYGTEMLLHAAQRTGWIAAEGWPAALTATVPTLVFLLLMGLILRRGGGESARSGSATGRAIAALGGAAGLANLALMFVIGVVAVSERSLKIWLIYPCTVMVLQALVWLVVYRLRRRAWFGLEAAGWLLVAGVMAGSVAADAMDVFIATAIVGLFGLMALPGWLMMRSAERIAAP